MNKAPRFGTVRQACEMIGGDSPIDASTYYRNAKKGIYPAPIKVGPNVARVDLDDLAARLRAFSPQTTQAA